MTLRLSVTSETASSSRPLTLTSPVWLVIGTLSELVVVTETFFWVRLYTAAVSRVLLPGGWYLMPSSHCLPSVGLNESVGDAVALLVGWNDSA
ncbi:hypothetical protein D3C87_1603920 [compost metagenome]